MADDFNTLTRPHVNTSATRDPLATDDVSQGYQVNSEWLNTTSLREWVCLSNALGAAKWSFGGADYADGGANPPNEQTKFGDATNTIAINTPFSTFGEEGNLYRNCGNPIASNGADLTDDILDGFVLPANCFDVANRQMMLNFNGKFATNGNNKRIKVWVNPTMAGQTVTNGKISGGTVTGVGAGVLLFDSGVLTDSNTGWQADVLVCKYGAVGSNTQYSIAQAMHGTTHMGSTLPVFATQPENATMSFVVTGASPTTGAAADVVLNYSEANAMN